MQGATDVVDAGGAVATGLALTVGVAVAIVRADVLGRDTLVVAVALVSAMGVVKAFDTGTAAGFAVCFSCCGAIVIGDAFDTGVIVADGFWRMTIIVISTLDTDIDNRVPAEVGADIVFAVEPRLAFAIAVAVALTLATRGIPAKFPIAVFLADIDVPTVAVP